MTVSAGKTGFVNEETGESADLSAIEDAGMGFDPTTQSLDLSKDEKRRTTALMMAITGYKELIIRDAAMLREVSDLARRNEGPQIRPATIDAMIAAAIKFDLFISGELTKHESSPGAAAASSTDDSVEHD